MEKEKFYIDLTFGKRKFDMDRMSEWTAEEWRAWVGQPEDHQEISFVLLDDDALYLKVSLIYYNEANNHMYVVFDMHNRLGQDIRFEPGEWKVDETVFDSPNMLPVHIKANEYKSGMEGSVAYMFMQSTLSMEFAVYEAMTKKPLRALAFDVKVYH
ncbi:MAG: hypothetical protein ACI33P_05810 [Lysinibacillus sp.]